MNIGKNNRQKALDEIKILREEAKVLLNEEKSKEREVIRRRDKGM